jgi:hypothetical protein
MTKTYLTTQTLIFHIAALCRLVESHGRFERELDHVFRCLQELPARAATEDSRIGVAVTSGSYWPISRPFVWSLGQEPTEQRILRKHPKLSYVWMFHRNGYLREAAIKFAELPSSPFFLAALTCRLNDWVDEVRIAAAQRLREWLNAVPASIIVATSTHLVERWQECQRWNLDARTLIELLLQREDVLPKLVQYLKSDSVPSAGALLRCLLRHASIDQHLLELATESNRPGVRRNAVRTLLLGRAEVQVGTEWQWTDKSFGLKRRVAKIESRALTTNVDMDALAGMAIVDKSALVRRSAADAIIVNRQLFKNLKFLTKSLCEDRNRLVSERGEFLSRT